jgi:hypothetical protein
MYSYLQQELQPGDCWEFAGRRGQLVVQRSYRIIIDGFTYEHIANELTPEVLTA